MQKLNTRYQTLRLILGDQLNLQHSWFKKANKDTLYVMIESRSETDYVKHHIQKVVGFFCAMREFAEALTKKKHHVLYLTLDDKKNEKNFQKNLTWIVKKYQINHFEYQLPDEYRLDQELQEIAKSLQCEETLAVDSEHFLTERNDIADFFEGKKSMLMESFYRDMRKQHQILMTKAGKPEGGKWNYDIENRKKCPKDMVFPESPILKIDVSDITSMLKQQKVKTFGEIDEKAFPWPINRKQSLQRLRFFLEHQLHDFGTYQDAMTTRHDVLFHSQISFSLNTKMISPSEVIEKAIEHWQDNKNVISLAQIEGFVRQILGWREYMRGIYWAKMPEYKTLNYFNHKRKLPSWYWTGKTKMLCLSHAISQSLQTAYAHHIQRLMVTGNFALLLGVNPKEVDEWYLGIYMDAIEWVQLPNTHGMSQFADGGILGSKPYVSSANYMNKMSDYCKQCHYDVKEKIGENACPFNSLYWHFYQKHKSKLQSNPRISNMYRVWERFSSDDQKRIMKQAEYVIEHVEAL